MCVHNTTTLISVQIQSNRFHRFTVNSEQKNIMDFIRIVIVTLFPNIPKQFNTLYNVVTELRKKCIFLSLSCFLINSFQYNLLYVYMLHIEYIIIVLVETKCTRRKYEENPYDINVCVCVCVFRLINHVLNFSKNKDT